MSIVFGSQAFCSASTVHVFGDSNALFNFTNVIVPIPTELVYTYEQVHTYADFQVVVPIVIHGFVSKTMHGVAKEGFLELKKFGVKENDIGVFAFGCVDVYYNIAKQRDGRGRNLDEIIDSLASNYINFIVRNRIQYQRLMCVVTSILPPYINIEGNIQDKIDITCRLNAKMKEYCMKNDILFLNIYDTYATKEGFLDPSLGDGNHHVKMECNYHIRKKLVELLIDHLP